MDKYEQRRLELVALRKRLGRGGIKQIAAKIDKEPSYVSRMLYPPDKDGAKAIGEDSYDLLVAAYPKDFSGNQATGEQVSAMDVQAIQIALRGLAAGVFADSQAAATGFLKNVKIVAGEQDFSMKKGLLGQIVKIAEAARQSQEAASHRPSPSGSRAHKKHGT